MLWIRVDRNSDIPMIRQLYLQIREAVLDGRLSSGTKTASSRELASQLQVSRNVVLEAYDMLIAEGFLEPRQGAGTFVADGAVYKRQTRIERPIVKNVNMGYDSGRGVINFRAGTPDLHLFPKRSWLKMIRDVLEAPVNEIFAYGHPEGRLELRSAICDYVVAQREVRCHPDQIVITAGTTQAIGLVCSLLLAGSQRDVVIEDPITHDIQLIIGNCGGRLHHVDVDNLGMVTDFLPREIQPAFVYVTPSHQFPIGGTLPIQRRIDLLQYAEEMNCYIVEDDYDSEFRFDGPPLSSLHGLRPERVVYIGTFSKTLCPAVRIGYIVLPAELIDRGRSRKWQSDLHNEVTSQLALARFIGEGLYLKHVGRMRKVYMQRRKALVKALENHFSSSGMEILGSNTGLHLTAAFRGERFTAGRLAEMEEDGAKFYGVWGHSHDPEKHRDKLLIGYGNLSEKKIEKGISLLAKALG